MATILIIDDEEQVRTLFQLALEEAGYHVISVESGREGLHRLEKESVDLVLVDIFMPGMDGLELIQLLRNARPVMKIIAMSGGTREWDYLAIAKRLGATATLKKPFSMVELVNAVASQLNS